MGKGEAVMNTAGVAKDEEEVAKDEVVAMGGCKTISVWIEEVVRFRNPYY